MSEKTKELIECLNRIADICAQWAAERPGEETLSPTALVAEILMAIWRVKFGWEEREVL